MVSRRKRGRGAVDNGEVNNDEETVQKGEGGGLSSGYENFRDQRIKENMERMQKLGILELSHKLKSDAAPQRRSIKNPSEKKASNPTSLSEPPRRSSRLKSMTPTNYSESRSKKENESPTSVEIRIPKGSEPEIYSEEHDKLLGDFKENWILSVDGCGEDGNRIYDPVKGESCHQCRQKTLGQRTRCSKCDLVQGKFCGDCLYMRYGENVIEANQDPDWSCPVCRGICNCSRCRRLKGWAPTGSIYRKVSKLGFKSVAHYLIQTRQPSSDFENRGSEGSEPRAKAVAKLSEGDESVDMDEDHDLEGEREDENISDNGTGKEEYYTTDEDDGLMKKKVNA